MALAVRIIPCLDVDDGQVVKGQSFQQLRYAGDPVELARTYDAAGADELTFLDISASHKGRKTIIDVVEAVAGEVFIPLTVGGGISSNDDIDALLQAGADKISINSAAVKNPELVGSAAQRFGSQCIVVAIDAKRDPSNSSGAWQVYTHGGRHNSGLDAVNWARQVVELGAGEILLTSMDNDGQKQGFDLQLTRAVSEAVQVPVIASGGVGKLEHLLDGVTAGKAQALLAASIFHYGSISIKATKDYLAEHGVEVRR